jgi:hypothetical protein
MGESYAKGRQVQRSSVMHGFVYCAPWHECWKWAMKDGGSLWASNTLGTNGTRVIMQDDGNLVIYDPQEHPVWASNTAGHPGAWLIVQDDGNVVIYDTNGNALWATNTPRIKVDSSNWVQRANGAIDHKERVALVVRGSQALTVAEGIRRFNGTNISGVLPVVVSVAIIVGVIAVVGLGVLAAVCLYGINKGYSVKARHITHGPVPFDDELEITLEPPAS